MFAKIYVFRVMPKEELMKSIEKYCQKNRITSGIIIGIIGSLERLKLSFLKELPGKYITKECKGPLEIVNCQGSIAKLIPDNKTVLHIHMTASNEKETVSGHLSEGIIFSTAEVVIGELDYQLKRKKDDHTGLNELIERD